MSKKPKLEASEKDDGTKVISINAGDMSPELTPPVRTAEVLPHVLVCVDTITGCSDAEVKNAAATLDFVSREVVVQICDLWKEVCRTAQKVGKDGEKSAKVSLSVKIDIDHTNLMMMDTEVSTNFALKFKEHNKWTEDLTQTKIVLHG